MVAAPCVALTIHAVPGGESSRKMCKKSTEGATLSQLGFSHSFIIKIPESILWNMFIIQDSRFVPVSLSLLHSKPKGLTFIHTYSNHPKEFQFLLCSTSPRAWHIHICPWSLKIVKPVSCAKMAALFGEAQSMANFRPSFWWHLHHWCNSRHSQITLKSWIFHHYLTTKTSALWAECRP